MSDALSLKKPLLGPGLLMLAGFGIWAGLYAKDYWTLKTKRSKLSTSLQDIDISNYGATNDAEEVRQKLLKGLKYIREYMVPGTDVSGGEEKEDHFDRRCIVYDFGGLSKLFKILRSEEFKDDVEVFSGALKAIYLMIKTSAADRRLIRNDIARSGGIDLLLDFVLDENQNESVREDAALCLRRATYTDYYKKDFVDDIPEGSNSTLKLIYKKDALKNLVELLKPNTFSKLNDGIIGALLHCSQLSEGARILSNLRLVEKLLNFVNVDNREFAVAAIFTIATIAIENVGPDAPLLLEETNLARLLKAVTGKFGPKVMKRVGDILYALANHLTLKGIYDQEYVLERRNLMCKLLATNVGASIQLFSLKHSANAEGRSRMYRLRHLMSQEGFSTNYRDVIVTLIEQADKAQEQENERKKKMMMPGMGGMPGMGDMSPELLQMLMAQGGGGMF